MVIEPTRAAPPELQNKRFGAMANPKGGYRVNYRGMWGNARLCKDTAPREVSGSSPSVQDC